MQTTIKQQLFNKLAEVQDLLEQATCDSESYAQSLQDNIGWAAELGIALRTLTDNVNYYVD